jgi:hypothetical protein
MKTIRGRALLDIVTTTTYSLYTVRRAVGLYSLYHELVRDVKCRTSSGVGMDHAASCVVVVVVLLDVACGGGGAAEKANVESGVARRSIVRTATIILMLVAKNVKWREAAAVMVGGCSVF